MNLSSLKSMYPFSVNTNICVPHFHNSDYFKIIKVKENQVHEALHILKWKNRFSFCRRKNPSQHSSFWSLTIEWRTRNSIKIQTLNYPLVKMISLPQASSSLRSNIKFTQKQETAKKSMEHSVSGKKSLLQPTPSPKFNDWAMETFLCGKTGDFVF